MNNPYSDAELMLLERAKWERNVMEKEEKARAHWKVTGSPEGLAQFRLRLQSWQENTTIFINVILIVILIIVIWEAYKQFTNPIEEKAVNNDKQFTNPDKEKAVNNQSEEKVDSNTMMAWQLKIRRIDSSHFGHPMHRQEVIVKEDKFVRRRD